MDNETNPAEVHAIAGKILEQVGELPASQEVLIAALKVAAATIEEAKMAQFSANIRAGILMNSRRK